MPPIFSADHRQKLWLNVAERKTNMDDMELFVMDEEKIIEEKPSAKRQFNDTLLAQLMWPAQVALPQGIARRVYGVMSDTPYSRRTRLYQH